VPNDNRGSPSSTRTHHKSQRASTDAPTNNKHALLKQTTNKRWERRTTNTATMIVIKNPSIHSFTFFGQSHKTRTQESPR
jgi:hypothetical protein